MRIRESPDNSRIVVFQLDRLVDRPEFASLAKPTGHGQTDEVTEVFTIQCGRFLEIAVEDFCLEHLVIARQRLLPDKGELPVLVVISGFQGDAVAVIALCLTLEKTGAIVGIGLDSEIAQIGIKASGYEIGGVMMLVVVPVIETTEQAAVERGGKLFRQQPIIEVTGDMEGVDLVLVTLGVDEAVVVRPLVDSHVRMSADLVESLRVALQASVGVGELEDVVGVPAGLEVGAADSPFHAVCPDGRVADHGDPRGFLVRLIIVTQLPGVVEIIAQGGFGAETPIVVVVLLLAIMQIACPDSCRIA